MKKSKFTFLGTGTSQGVPVIACKCKVCQSVDKKDNRLRTSAMLMINDTTIVIDSGPDFRCQMLRESVENIDAILFTHEHKDHIAGLDDIRAFNFINKKAIDIYAEKRVEHALMREFSYVFAKHKYPGVPQIQFHQIRNSVFKIKNIEVIPIRALHYFLPVFAYRFGDLTYITDANFIAEDEFEKILGTKILIINSLRKESHISHFTLDQALEIINKIQPEKAYLTHLSHQIGLHEDLQKSLPENVYVAYDGLSFRF